MKDFLFLLALLLFCSPSAAQEESRKEPLSKTQRLESYMHQAEKSAELYPQEKVYLHFDNTSYYLNEHIWFKAYVTQAQNHSLSSRSKTLYVELLNKDGFLVERKVYPVVDGLAKGDFRVSDSCEAGFYEIRAYTRWMRNWDEACVFSRVFPVFNEPETPNLWQQTLLQRERAAPLDRRKENAQKAPKFQLLFFPEGGTLVEGITSQVAFKVLDEEGASVLNVLGKIYSKQTQKAVLDINTRHNGMGVFSLTPQKGEEYVARITVHNESYEFDLPAALPQGYTMQINNYPPARLIVTIQKSDTLQADTLGFTASCRGKVLVSQLVITTDSTGAQFSLPKEQLPEGVLQLTLFNCEGKILCERRAFVQPPRNDRAIKIHLQENDMDFNSAALNEIGFRLTDAQGVPLARTGLSVSVRDGKTELSNWNHESARINLLLSSDLKGYIENPAYYFEKVDNVRLQNLDLLMLVQGWRRYDWQEMSGAIPFTPRFKAEKGITIDGRVTHLMNKKKPYPDVRLSYLLFGATNKLGFDFDELRTDEAGEFETTLQFFGIRPIVIQSRNKKNKRRETYIQLYRNFRPAPRVLNPMETRNEFILRHSIEESTRKQLESLNRFENEKQLEEVFVEGSKQKLKKRLAHRNIVIDVDRAIDEIRDDGLEPSSINEVLKRYDPYYSSHTSHTIQGLRHNGKPLKIVYGSYNPIWQDKAVHHYANETEISPIGIQTITIFEKGASGVDSLGNHVTISGSPTAVIKLHKDAHKKQESYGIRKSRIQGYNVVSSFYSPQYIVPRPESYDGRRTLMWLPDLVTNEQGYGTIEFYNSPTCREFIFDIQCVSKEGKIGSFYGIFHEGNTQK